MALNLYKCGISLDSGETMHNYLSALSLSFPVVSTDSFIVSFK